MIAALEAVIRDVGEEAGTPLPTDPSAAESVVVSLVNDLDTTASNVVLVLDDYK